MSSSNEGCEFKIDVGDESMIVTRHSAWTRFGGNTP